MITTNIKALTAFKYCTNSYNPLTRRCRFCIAHDLCLKENNYIPKLPNQKTLD